MVEGESESVFRSSSSSPSLFPVLSSRSLSPFSRHFTHLDLLDLAHLDLLQNELSDPVPLGDLKVRLAMVEKQDEERPAVVGVDDTGARLDRVLGGETRPRGDAAVGAEGDGEGEVRRDEGFASGGDRLGLGAGMKTLASGLGRQQPGACRTRDAGDPRIEVEASRERRAPGGKGGARRETLDEELGGGGGGVGGHLDGC